MGSYKTLIFSCIKVFFVVIITMISGFEVVMAQEPGSLRSKSVLQEQQDEILVEAFSPDGSALAVVSSNGNIKIFNTRTRKLSLEILKQWESVTSLAYSPDGLTLAAGVAQAIRSNQKDMNMNWCIMLFDSADGRRKSQLGGARLEGRRLTFSPDGKTLASSSVPGRK